MVLWRLWYRRNSVFNGRLQPQVVDVVDWAGSFFDEFIYVSYMPRPPPVTVNSVVMWIAPSNNVSKINTDAAFDESANLWDICLIIRDANGLVMSAYTVPRPDGFSPQITEGLAILRGLQLVVEFNLLLAVCEIDANLLGVCFVPKLANKVIDSLAKAALLLCEESFWVKECPPWVESLVLDDSLVSL
ncbi:hypothetical protein ACOSQ4_005368 [Xanthoceras sorbifolium]